MLRIIEDETGILASLVEKDYWIMHCLYGLQRQGYKFQLKGGTSLSKGFGMIDRFSEDIDLNIDPPAALGINENPNNKNPGNIGKKKQYYDDLADEISIPGIVEVIRDTAFDDERRYNNGGIRLYYQQVTMPEEGIKHGILLEAGYDCVAPNIPLIITSWAYEKAREIAGPDLIDNRATGISCYDHRYTFVEKIQTIATKFRKEKTTGKIATNYLRQYYDVFCLLDNPEVVAFIGTDEYLRHKERRFPDKDFNIPIRENEAFLLTDAALREQFRQRYKATAALYYKGQLSFHLILERIRRHIDLL